MARYSTVLNPYSLYNSASYGSGDNPDFRLLYLQALPTDSERRHTDDSGNPIFGRVTLFWQTYSQAIKNVKILRSTHGPSMAHNDPFSAPVACSRLGFDIVGEVARYSDGFTVVSTDAPHLLRAGDLVSIDGNAVATGEWRVNSVLNPAQFSFYNPWFFDYEDSAEGGTVTVIEGLSALPTLGSAEKYFTDTSVIPGVEYHYSIFLEDPTPGVTEWTFAGTVTVRAPIEFESFQRLVSLLPPYMTNRQFDIAGVPTVDTLLDTDYDLRPTTAPSFSKYLAGLGWAWDDVRTDLSVVSRPWDPQGIPDAALTPALATMGLGNPVSLSNRSLRTLLSNAPLVNEFRGTVSGLITLAESITGLSAEVGIGYNLMPSVDDAEFHLSTGHWTVFPASLNLEAVRDEPLAGGDTVLEVAVSPEDVATSNGSAYLNVYVPSGEPVLSLGMAVPVTGISPGPGNAVRDYTVFTAFPHGLAPGDVVTTSTVLPVLNSAESMRMVVVSAQTPTTVTVRVPNVLEDEAAFLAVFGGGEFGFNALAAAVNSKNPFAVANGIAVRPNTAYTFSLEGACANYVSPVVTAYCYDAFGNLLTTSNLVAQAAYDDAGIAYDSGDIVYDAGTSVIYEETVFTKSSITFNTSDRTRYLALSVGVSDDISGYALLVRRFMVAEGRTALPYQSPRLVSIDLRSLQSSTTWGATRTNLILDPGFEGTPDMSPTSGTFGEPYSSLYAPLSQAQSPVNFGYSMTVSPGSTDTVLATRTLTVPSPGTYTVSAYFAPLFAGAGESYGTAARLWLGQSVDGYSTTEFSSSYVGDGFVLPESTPTVYANGPQDGTTFSHAEWMSTLDEAYDVQPVLEVNLPNSDNNARDVIGYEAGLWLSRSSGYGNAGRVAVSAGLEYRASAFLRSPSTQVRVAMQIQFFDTEGNPLNNYRSSTAVISPDVHPRGYTQISVKATAPAGSVAAVIGVVVPGMERENCGSTLYLTCPSLTLSSNPEILGFKSARIGGENWSRAHMTVRVSKAGDLPIAVRVCGLLPIPGANYCTTCWLFEESELRLGYFDGNSGFQTSPYFAGWTGDAANSPSRTGMTLPTSAVSDTSNTNMHSAIEHLRQELPNSLALGTPYRITLDGLLEGTPVAEIDPTFRRTYPSTIY